MKAPQQKELFDLVKKSPKKTPLRSSPRTPVEVQDLHGAAEFHRRRCMELRQEVHPNGFAMRAAITQHEDFATAIEAAIKKLVTG